MTSVEEVVSEGRGASMPFDVMVQVVMGVSISKRATQAAAVLDEECDMSLLKLLLLS